jgi:hypothetical protein
MSPFSLPSKPVDFSVVGFVEDGDVGVEGVGVVVVGVVEVVGVRLCIGVFGTVGAVEAVFDGADEIPYTMTASALRSTTVVVCAERDPSSFNNCPGDGNGTVTAAASP